MRLEYDTRFKERKNMENPMLEGENGEDRAINLTKLALNQGVRKPHHDSRQLIPYPGYQHGIIFPSVHPLEQATPHLSALCHLVRIELV
jgi:hypothetical protein